jgi:RNA polymerase-binding transcription factor DksA
MGCGRWRGCRGRRGRSPGHRLLRVTRCALLEDVEAEIADVRRALVRLDRGSYGRCEACGRQIPDERLSAVPAARFCFEHQAAAEVIGGLET